MELVEHSSQNSINISVAYQLKNFYIDVSNNSDGSSSQLCANDDQPFRSSETRVYTCRNYLKGRYVRIRYPSDYQQHLQLCEVQVQGMGRSIHTLNVCDNKMVNLRSSIRGKWVPIIVGRYK